MIKVFAKRNDLINRLAFILFCSVSAQQQCVKFDGDASGLDLHNAFGSECNSNSISDACVTTEPDPTNIGFELHLKFDPLYGSQTYNDVVNQCESNGGSICKSDAKVSFAQATYVVKDFPSCVPSSCTEQAFVTSSEHPLCAANIPELTQCNVLSFATQCSNSRSISSSNTCGNQVSNLEGNSGYVSANTELIMPALTSCAMYYFTPAETCSVESEPLVTTVVGDFKKMIAEDDSNYRKLESGCTSAGGKLCTADANLDISIRLNDINTQTLASITDFSMCVPTGCSDTEAANLMKNTILERLLSSSAGTSDRRRSLSMTLLTPHHHSDAFGSTRKLQDADYLKSICDDTDESFTNCVVTFSNSNCVFQNAVATGGSSTGSSGGSSTGGSGGVQGNNNSGGSVGGNAPASAPSDPSWYSGEPESPIGEAARESSSNSLLTVFTGFLLYMGTFLISSAII